MECIYYSRKAFKIGNALLGCYLAVCHHYECWMKIGHCVFDVYGLDIQKGNIIEIILKKQHIYEKS